MRILVIEDDAIIAMAAETTLHEAGHDVVGPFTTLSAARAAARIFAPDIALVDINLDGGEEGVLMRAHCWPSMASEASSPALVAVIWLGAQAGTAHP